MLAAVSVAAKSLAFKEQEALVLVRMNSALVNGSAVKAVTLTESSLQLYLAWILSRLTT